MKIIATSSLFDLAGKKMKKSVGKPGLIFFHHNWCPHCVTMKADFDKFAHGSGVVGYVAEGATNEAAFTAFGVSGVPHLKFVSASGKVATDMYEGQRTASEMTKYVMKRAGMKGGAPRGRMGVRKAAIKKATGLNKPRGASKKKRRTRKRVTVPSAKKSVFSKRLFASKKKVVRRRRQGLRKGAIKKATGLDKPRGPKGRKSRSKAIFARVKGKKRSKFNKSLFKKTASKKKRVSKKKASKKKSASKKKKASKKKPKRKLASKKRKSL